LTGEPQAVSRTFLDADGQKIERKFLGPTGGAAIKLDSDENVLGGLYIGEGIETCMAARAFGLRPAWALGSAGAIAAFPVLAGIECLTLLAEHDEASARAIQSCGNRWHAAGREVLVNRAIGGKDLADVGGASA
jgi:putative DNA primase/helicase